MVSTLGSLQLAEPLRVTGALPNEIVSSVEQFNPPVAGEPSVEFAEQLDRISFGKIARGPAWVITTSHKGLSSDASLGFASITATR